MTTNIYALAKNLKRAGRTDVAKDLMRGKVTVDRAKALLATARMDADFRGGVLVGGGG